MIDDYALNPQRVRCARCGEVARGSASIASERYCHGDQERPTCYMAQQWDNAFGKEPVRCVPCHDGDHDECIGMALHPDDGGLSACYCDCVLSWVSSRLPTSSCD